MTIRKLDVFTHLVHHRPIITIKVHFMLTMQPIEDIVTNNKTLLKTADLKKHFEISKGMQKYVVKALNGVSFTLQKNETLGVVGESGCGKSTLAKVLLGLYSITSGDVLYSQKSLKDLSPQERQKKIQMIFQDPYGSLNPRQKAWKIIAEPLFINSNLSKDECYEKVIALMEQVGLRKNLAHRYPHMFSGGQRQRLGIARGLVLRPDILILDEPVSALDVSIQAQVINLLQDIQNEFKLSYLFISHDLSVVQYFCDHVAVMYLGEIVEKAPKKVLFQKQLHPYTKALLGSAPHLKKDSTSTSISTTALKGELPSPINLPKGCTFHPRCPYKTKKCEEEKPKLLKVDKNHFSSCHHWEELQ